MLYSAVRVHICTALVAIYCVTPCTSGDKRQTDSPEKFVPTSEWQKVEKGQPLPAGLHYRLNINTGETEAKLLDSEESKDVKDDKTGLVALTAEKTIDESDTAPYLSKDQLQKILADIPSDDSDTFLHDPKDEHGKQKSDGEFRSYEELKKEFSSLNLSVKTDMEILNELTKKAKQYVTSQNEEEETVIILKDLEYLVHQIDNAREFVRLGGLTHIVVPALNSTSPNIRAESLWLLGSASQSNPKVQIAVISSGILSKLVKVAALDPDVTVLSKAVYALSCLMRQFPNAQAKFIEEGGLASLSGILDNKRTADFKTKMKVITLIDDLLTEHASVKRAVQENEGGNLSNESEAAKKLQQHKRAELREKLRQYEAINLGRHLMEDGWCHRISDFFWKLYESGINSGRTQRRDDLGSIISKDVPYRPEHDAIEKVADTILVLKDSCAHKFQEDVHLDEALHQFLKWYEDLRMREEVLQKQPYDSKCEDSLKCPTPQNESDHVVDDSDMYYTSIAERLKEILEFLKKPTVNPIYERDEL